MKLFIRIVIFAGLIVAPAVLAVTSVITNDYDDREFEYFELENKLKVLLVSDKKSKKAAVALDVFVGSGDDPKNIEGLAHFLEHMLFLGTDKYPLAGEFQDFIGGHGGNHNAYTSLMHTNYFFDIDADSLSLAIDRFSRFFISPSFDAVYVDREKNAVHSEYSSKLLSESRRENDVIRELVKPGHPLSRFSTGNKNTLGSVSAEKLRTELIDFYDHHYSANNMTLVVTGPQGLDELRVLVVDAFSKIKNKKTVTPKTYSGLFSEGFLPVEVHIKPKKEKRKLSLIFPVPNTLKYVKEKPLYYIGNFIGHEGKGSLLSLFKDMDWATGLSAGGGAQWRGGETFSINIALTALGLKNVDTIYQLVFEYIDLLAKQGVEKWRYDELAKISNLSFKYGEQGEAINEVSSLARVLHEVVSERVYWNAYSLEKFDDSLIKNYIYLLTKDNVFTILTAPEVTTDQTSLYYDTPYRVVKKGSGLSEEAYDLNTLENFSNRLVLPKKNPFVAEKLKIHEQSFAGGDKLTPKLIFDKKSVKGWYLNDNIYDLPKGQIKARYTLPVVAESAKNYAALSLYVSILRESLNETSYAASIAGLSYGLRARPRGMLVDFYGYNDTLLDLSRTVFAQLKRFAQKEKYRRELVDVYFDSVKSELLRKRNNVKYDRVFSQVLREVPSVMHTPYWSNADIADAIGQMDKLGFLATIKTIFDGGYCDALVFGNINKREAKKYFSSFSKLLMFSSQKLATQGQIVKLPAQTQFAKLIDVDAADAVSVLYVQGRTDSLAEQARFSLLQKIIEAPFYHSLRTEQQLGYLVMSANYEFRDVPGLVMLVQSPTVDAVTLYKKTVEFFSQKKNDVFSSFERDKDSLLTDLKQPLKNQMAWSNYFWNSISEYDNDFSKKSRFIDAVTSLEKDELVKLYDELLIDNKSGIVFLTRNENGNEQLKSLNSSLVEINDYIQFKKSMSKYLYR